MPELDNLTPQSPPEPAERRDFPWLRVLAGLMLVVAAVAVAVALLGPEELAVTARFEPESPLPGAPGRLIVQVEPASPEKSGPLQNVRVQVEPPAGLVFERTSEFLLPHEKEMALSFTVDRKAAPGARRIVVVAIADLPAGAQRSVARTVDVRRELELVIADPKAAAARAGKP